MSTMSKSDILGLINSKFGEVASLISELIPDEVENSEYMYEEIECNPTACDLDRRIHYDPNSEYMTSSQLYDKFKNDERISDSIRLYPGLITLFLRGYGLVDKYSSRKNIFATEIGLKTGWMFNDSGKTVYFKNNEETDKYIVMMFNNPRKFSRYVMDLEQEDE